MARPNQFLIDKLRETAARIEGGADYNWGSISRCNCGLLAESITPLTRSEIHQSVRGRTYDEWTEFANDYCPHSGAPIDEVMDQMFDAGLERHDIHELEYLTNKDVLQALPGGFRYLQKGNRRDAALYLRTWAEVLEIELKDLQYSLETRPQQPPSHRANRIFRVTPNKAPPIRLV